MYTVTYPNAWIILPLLGALSTAISIYIAYLVLKCAIRNGINESRLRLEPTTQQMAPIGYKWALVKDEKHQAADR
ncbi:hypothetical protein [Comamonas sp. JNW]|uniref:hypothetical protein n=1 Tax=Comamonas sp. JNW TaxID=2170731 RepID=UPI000DE727F9|nr:hypothetical protein [Comamonas sp. JNW]PWB18840.1 hypothetical protein DCO45_09695 [Comamonas sp. JNW]